MSIRIISIKEDGVYNQSVEELTEDELMNLELSLMVADPKDLKLSCISCFAVFQGGTMNNKCEKCR